MHKEVSVYQLARVPPLRFQHTTGSQYTFLVSFFRPLKGCDIGKGYKVLRIKKKKKHKLGPLHNRVLGSGPAQAFVDFYAELWQNPDT